MTRQRHYHVFGGPDGRSIATVDANVSYFVAGSRARGRLRPFEYVLVDAAHGVRAFVPRHNSDLIEALHVCPEQIGDLEWETLRRELDRRGLKLSPT